MKRISPLPLTFAAFCSCGFTVVTDREDDPLWRDYDFHEQWANHNCGATR